ncbi:thiamine pyrophosphate-dependent dehydrogenase E1 component subunit alpha [Streptomyces cacaoi]|uniref:thiamine pyrophosphate-dependent dehydrogenase E1 component subunit alpha n=1 Tax=Streptomyces cacaoi TaxID=1898 RepID=UPI0037482914
MSTSAVAPAQPSLSALDDEDLLLMLTIRHFELTLLDLFARGELNGTTHTCLGQEYIPVALESVFTDSDFVFSNHRGHGHYLARHRDPRGLLAEIMGREGAVCSGVGGSQHILRGRYLSTGVQGQSLPVAAGVALRLKRTEPGALACAYIGDGTWGEGSVYEALNMARLWELPLLVVVEHNGIAQTTPTTAQLSGSISGRAAAFGVDHVRSDSTDVVELRALLGPAVRRVRRDCRPLVVELATHRVGPHSKGDDTRPEDERAAAEADDWYRRYPPGHEEQFARLDERARAAVADVAREVRRLGPSRWDR